MQIKINEFKYKNKKNIQNDVLLKNIHFELVPGQITSILGPSGCGKSTLLRILMGLESHALGSIHIPEEQRSINLEHIHSLKKPLFSLMQQNTYLLPWKTIFENCAFVLAPTSKNNDKKMILDLFEIVGLKNLGSKYPWELSVGQQNRVSFVRSYLCAQYGLLLDEPFCALDAFTRKNMQEFLVDMCKKRNIRCLLVTHDEHEAHSVSRTILKLGNTPTTILVCS